MVFATLCSIKHERHDETDKHGDHQAEVQINLLPAWILSTRRIKSLRIGKKYAVIMAGGGWTRLWHVSRKESPKQLLPLIGQDILFQSTVKRLENLFTPDRILVVTVEDQAREICLQASEIPEKICIIEPALRGTASVVSIAAEVLHKRDVNASMAILSSDNFIRNRNLFHYLFNAAFDVAESGYLVTLGITPTHPSTAYGYIQQGQPLNGQYKYHTYTVKRFIEKPDEQTV